MKDQNKNPESYRLSSIAAFILGSIGLVSIFYLDKLYWWRDISPRGWPKLSFDYLMRSMAIFISLTAIYWSLVGRKKPQLEILDKNGVLIERLSILGTLSISVIFLLLFLLKPTVFSALSLEDGPIEWSSAILLFSTCITFLIAFVKCRDSSSIPKFAQSTLIFLAFASFIIAMEEVSWFQRVMEIETPDLFRKNQQHEINLHNFVTNQSENIYYFGASLFLVISPFLRVPFFVTTHNNYLNLFVPRPFISIIGAVACAYNFDMWNIIYTQIYFFSAVIILFIFAIYCNHWHESGILIFTISLVVITQIFFLTNGENFFHRIWEIKEYKEFFIPLAFFIYSLSVYSNVEQVYLAKEESYEKEAIIS